MVDLLRPELIDIAVNLYFADRKVDLLNEALDNIEALADKQVMIANTIVPVETQLRNLSIARSGAATGAATYSQERSCSVARAGVPTLNEGSRVFHNAMKSQSLYQSGGKKALARNLAASSLTSMGGAKVNALRAEDAKHDESVQRRADAIASATGGLSYSASTFAGLNRFYESVVDTTISNINRLSINAASSLGVLEGDRQFKNNEAQSKAQQQVVSDQIGREELTRKVESANKQIDFLNNGADLSDFTRPQTPASVAASGGVTQLSVNSRDIQRDAPRQSTPPSEET